jgi:hypothetical protein
LLAQRVMERKRDGQQHERQLPRPHVSSQP